jgi:mycothiol synthase
MKNRAYIIRNYRPGDFDSLVRLVAEAETRGERLYSTSTQDVIEGLGRPRHFPENDLFIAERAGDMVGYVDVTVEVDIGRVVLSYLVHSEHRGEVVAMKLIGRAISRARELEVKRVHVNVPEGSVGARQLFTKLGFRFIRRFLELDLDLSEVYVPNTDRIESRYRHLKRGDEDKLLHIQNRSFADTWGFNPNTVEEIVYRTGLPHCSPEDIILACDGDRVIGYCWTRIYVGGAELTINRKGRIYMLGVDPDYRGRGVGKEVLMAGLAYLRTKDVGIVELTVDGKNEAALALYGSAGFRVRTGSLWYERALE